MVKSYNTEPVSIEEAKATLNDIILDITGLEAKLTKVENERDKKDQEWKELNARYDSDIKKAKAGKPAASSMPSSTEILNLRKQVKDLQTENNQYNQLAKANQKTLTDLNQVKRDLEAKIKLLESQQGKTQTETPEVSPWEIVKVPAIYLGGLLVVLLVYTFIKNKAFGK